MAWPPPGLPFKNDYANADQQADLHPTSHNEIANTLNADFYNQVESNRQGVLTNLTDIATHNSLYADSGAMTLPQPSFRSANRTELRDASAGFIAYTDGAGAGSTARFGGTSFAAPGSWLDVTSTKVTIDMASVNGGRGCSFLVTASVMCELKPGESLSVIAASSTDGAATSLFPGDTTGKVVNSLSPGTVTPDVQSLTYIRHIGGGASSVDFYPAVYATGGTVETLDKRIAVIPFWQ